MKKGRINGLFLNNKYLKVLRDWVKGEIFIRNYIVITFISSILAFVIRTFSIMNKSDQPILSYYHYDLVILGVIIIYSGFLLFVKRIKPKND